jgi:methionine aminotransferase
LLNPIIHSKLPSVGTTIFTTMSALAVKHNAINLGQGFPDFPMNSELQELVDQAMKDGYNQYVHMCGLPALREQLSQKVNEDYNANINPETQITITPGGTYAIYTAFTTILRPGDEVILFEPAYDSYIPNIEINGGVAVPVALEFPDYRINWQLVKEKITSKTKAIIINTPHNPTGKVLEESDIDALRALVKDTGIFIISDEVYEHLIFDNKPHLSLLRYPDLLERTFVCFSFGKVYHCTGWKLGYCMAPEPLMKEFRKVHQFNCFTCNSPVQVALSKFLQQKKEYKQLGFFLQQKRDYFQQLMQQTSFKALPSHGSYFQMYEYGDISTQTENEFAIRLTEEAGVTTIPVSAFYKTPTDNRVLRFCFAKKESTLEEAVERLVNYFG